MICWLNEYVATRLKDKYKQMNSVKKSSKFPLLSIMLFLSIIFMQACSATGKPEGITPISGFDLNRYLGTWYEIARLDHKFERGLEQVTANYSLNADSTVKVINRGFSVSKKEWEQAVGKAQFVGNTDEGHLKVSFFGPFYGSYIVFDLDEANYQYALVSGPDKSYLWVLSRTPALDSDIYNNLVSKAEAAGFDTSQQIKVRQQSDS